MLSQFDLKERVFIITGGAGLLGIKHAEAIAEVGGIPILLDLDNIKAEKEANKLSEKFNVPALGLLGDVYNIKSLNDVLSKIQSKYQRIDGLINNAYHC